MMNRGLWSNPQTVGLLFGSGFKQLLIKSIIKPISFLWTKIDSSANFFNKLSQIYWADFFAPENAFEVS